MAIPEGFELVKPEEPPSTIPEGFELVEAEKPPEKDLLEQAENVLQTAGSSLFELAAGVNRATASIVDTFGIDQLNTIQRLLRPITRSTAQIPRAAELTVPKGTFGEEGLLTDISAAVGETIPSALAVGQGLRQGAQQLSKIVAGAEGVLPGFLRTAGQTGARTDIIAGGLSGAGAAAGAAAGKALGGEGQIISEEQGAQIGELTGAFAGPLLPGLIKAPKIALTNLLNIAKSKPTAEQAQILQAGKNQGFRVFTTDVVPPDTFLGRWAQSLSEKLGIFGTGFARAEQQIARQNVVEDIAKEFKIDIDSDLTGDIVRSLNKTAARKMASAELQRNEAITTFNQFGKVPLPNLEKTINKIVTSQAKKGPKQNDALVKNAEDTLEASKGADDFEVLAAIRTDIIDDVLAVKNKVESTGLDFRTLGELGAIKSAFDKDMALFSRGKGERVVNAGKQWRQANRNISKELETTKNTELARIFRSGKANPEQVLPIITSGKKSQLQRLNKSLSDKGREGVRATIVQDALRRSGFLKGDINPDRFATALERPQVQRAVNVFFTGRDRKQIEGIKKLLGATRRAQQAALNLQTGQQLLPFAAVRALTESFATHPLRTLVAAPSVIAVGKIYESPAFRTLMIKLANARKGSIIERRLLNAAVPGILAGARTTEAIQKPVSEIGASIESILSEGAE